MSEAMRAAAELYGDPRFYDKSRLRVINNRKRRERELRRHIITFVVMISVLIILSMFIFFSFKSDASVDSAHQQYRYYTSVTVTSGDSVWSIAREHMDPLHYRSVESMVNDIASVNRISPEAKLNAGTNIIVPYYSDELK